MTHLNIEEIAALAEGNIEKKEHERLTKHIADCEECFKAYSDTLEFVAAEREQSSPRRRFQAAVQEAAQRFGQTISARFHQNKILKPAPVFAFLLIFAVVLPVLLVMIPGRGKPESAVTQHLQERYKDLGGGSAFAGSADEVYAAFRTGVFFEDLSRLQGSSGEKRLKQKIAALLRKDLRLLNTAGVPVKKINNVLARLEKENFHRASESISAALERRSLDDLFLLARFIEKSLLDTFNDKRPSGTDISVHFPALKKHNLPEGVPRGLRQIGETAAMEDIREVLENITSIFLTFE